MTQAVKMTRRRLSPSPPSKSVRREAELNQMSALAATRRQSRPMVKPSQPRKLLIQVMTQATPMTSQRRRPQLPRLPQQRKLQPRSKTAVMIQAIHQRKSQRRRLQLLKPHLPKRPQPRKIQVMMTAIVTVMSQS